jgi:hypothetical protein
MTCGYDAFRTLEVIVDRTHVVEGRLNDPRHIELDEPLVDVQGRVQVTVRPITQPEPGSPQGVLRVVRSLPDLDPNDIDELERSIETGKLPARSEGLFDSDPE